MRHVVRQEWHALPEGAREAVSCTLDEQRENAFIHFATPRRMDLSTLAKWCRWGKEKAGARVIMLEHFHRLAFGSGSGLPLFEST